MLFSDVKHPGTFDSEAIIVVVCCTLGLYNALELLLLIFTTFQHYSGLYFWALLIASFGVIPYAVGWLIVYFELTINWIGFVIDNYGWVTMVTGQSVVLYSRLHFVLRNSNVLRAVKWMIIIDALVFHITTIIVHFGSNLGNHESQFNKAWNVVEKVQMTGFCLQEFIISGIYVWKTVELLQVVKKKGTKRVMWQLFIINIIIIAMDIGLLVLEYRHLRVMEQAFKVVIYSVKLKLEFAILGKLVEIVQQNGREMSRAFADTHEYVDETKISVDMSAVTRTDSFSRPQWLDDLEKSNDTLHVERMKPSCSKDAAETRVMNIDLEPVQSRSTTDSSIGYPRAVRTRTDSDLMYAEAMRSITTSSK